MGTQSFPGITKHLTGTIFGYWASQRRYEFKNNQLSKKHYDMLNKLGFPFVTNRHRPTEELSAKWDEAYNYLCEYYNTFGNTEVPEKYICEGGFRLGNWVKFQRYMYNNDLLLHDRQKKLEALNFRFYPNLAEKQAYAWETGYSHLLKYIDENGHALVSPEYKCADDNYPLGKWVKAQKTSYRNGRLKQDRKDKLEKLHMDFHVSYRKKKTEIESSAWLIGFSHLLDYINEYGTTIVPTEYSCPADNYPLGTWVYNQRKDFKLNRLHNDRYNKLKELGFIFSVHAGRLAPHENAYTWINGISHLTEYTKIYHNTNVKRDYISPDGYRLGSWVKNIRNSSYNSLSVSQIKQLEALGFCFTGCRRGGRPG